MRTPLRSWRYVLLGVGFLALAAAIAIGTGTHAHLNWSTDVELAAPAPLLEILRYSVAKTAVAHP